MTSFTNYRYANINRSQSVNDENSKDLKATIRESRWIQPEQWELPEIQEKFAMAIILFLNK